MTVRRVGSCRIIREVGRGAMGIVYEAQQESLNRTVAIKELPAELATQEELVTRFRREGAAYAQLNHQSIIGVYDLIEKRDALYLVTEFVDGANLAEVLKKGGPLPIAAVAVIGAEICGALEHVHYKKLVHRDIKPANIMLAKNGVIKLTDFGIAKNLAIETMTKEGMVLGSLPYMAPEVLSTGDYDPRSDIWALGVTLYELVTGQRPFVGKDDATVAGAIWKGQFKSIRKVRAAVPYRLARAIERCLRPKPAQRWHSAAELGQSLGEAALLSLEGRHPQQSLAHMMKHRGYEPTASEPTAIDPASRFATRASPAIPPSEPKKRWTRWLAAFAVLVAGLGGSLFWLRH